MNWYEIRNANLPSVEKWLNRKNDCGEKISKGKWCSNGNKKHVWECVAVKVIVNFEDWYKMKPPFKLTLGFGYDGFVNSEIGAGGKWNRCIKSKSFIPVQNSDFQWVDTFSENQWSRAEISVGAQGVIRPQINSSSDYITTLDLEGRGIICFYDKLWITSFLYYVADGSITSNYDMGFECIFQPVQMERFDYLQHLIDRSRCNNECIDQNVVDLPCISKDCVFKSADLYTDEEEVILPDKKITGKEAKRKGLKAGELNCVDVCVVSQVGDQCEKYKEEILTLTEENAKLSRRLHTCLTKNETLTKENVQLVENVRELTTKIDTLNAEIVTKNDLISSLNEKLKESQKEYINCQVRLGTVWPEPYQNNLVYSVNKIVEYLKKQGRTDAWFTAWETSYNYYYYQSGKSDVSKNRINFVMIKTKEMADDVQNIMSLFVLYTKIGFIIQSAYVDGINTQSLQFFDNNVVGSLIKDFVNNPYIASVKFEINLQAPSVNNMIFDRTLLQPKADQSHPQTPEDPKCTPEEAKKSENSKETITVSIPSCINIF